MKKPIVLNLSDIHYKNKPDGTAIGIRNSAYFKSIREEINTIKPTHIIINGDMAFSASLEQFNNCYEELLDDYLRLNPKVRFILIPGNHSCQRDVPKTILKNLGNNISLNYKDLENKQEVEKTIDKEINTNEVIRLNILKELRDNCAGFDNNEDLLNKNDDIKLFELLFYNYTKFTKHRVIKRLKSINNGNDLLEFESYEKSNGLHGIIYDKEYNIIFSCLNSVSYSWGEETFEDLQNNSFDFLFQEYGNLGFRVSDEIVFNELKELERRNVLNQSIVCLLSHVPLSWLSAKTQFGSGSRLTSIFQYIDIALFGHIHVKHFAPTLYRGRTLIFESPQLFEHKFCSYSNEEIRDKKSEIDPLGFSVFKFFEDNYKFNHKTYNMPIANNFEKINGDYKFKWDDNTLELYDLPLHKKSLLTCYDSISSVTRLNNNSKLFFLSSECGFYRYIKGIAKNKIVPSHTSIQIHEEIFIDLHEFCISYYSSLISSSGKDGFGFLTISKTGDMNVILNLKKEIKYFDLYSKIQDFICNIDTNLINGLKNIIINVFDYELFYIFGDDNQDFTIQNESFWHNYYRKRTIQLENLIVKFKANFFSMLVEITDNEDYALRCRGKSIYLSDIGIDIDIITLDKYKDFLKKN